MITQNIHAILGHSYVIDHGRLSTPKICEPL